VGRQTAARKGGMRPRPKTKNEAVIPGREP
jgi:hypothetical protein